MECTRTKQVDFISPPGDWECPKCGSSEGIELMCETPCYMQATPRFDQGVWVAEQDPDGEIDVYWEGSSADVVLCKECRFQLAMEITYP